MFKQYPNALRFHRKKAGLRQHQVARSLGLNRTDRISRWENGAIDPNLENVLTLSALYKANPQELFPEQWRAISDRIAGSTGEALSEGRIPAEEQAYAPSGLSSTLPKADA